MPLTYKLNPPIVQIKSTGDVEYTSGLEVTKAALREARKVTQDTGNQFWDLLFDLQEANESRSTAELQGIAMVLAQYMDILTGRMAIVVVDTHMAGLAGAFGVFAEKLGHKPQLFGTSKEAEAWLGESS